ncbi:MAG: NAD(P)H-binding protein [Gemmatimonadota bacterium]
MNLVVGATGSLGTRICRELIERGQQVRATSNPDRLQTLRSFGAQLFRGDLTHPASLEQACEGIDAVISTATVVSSQAHDDTFTAVDDAGQRALIDAAIPMAATAGEFGSAPRPLSEVARELVPVSAV